MADPMMNRIMDVDDRPRCRCDYGEEPCTKPSVPGDLLCAGCIFYCIPLAQGKNPFTQEAGDG